MSIIFRPGVLDDNFAAYRIHHHAIADLIRRLGFAPADHVPTQEEIIQGWKQNRSLYEHLTRTAEQFWVAEQAGEIVGYSRSCNHDGVRQLSEFFVHPGLQANGVGKELLARAFPREHARLRLVTATPELRAQALYMRSGVYARQLLYRFLCTPQPVTVTADLVVEPAPALPVALPLIAALDDAILGFQRADDHAWLLSDRQGWLYRRQGQVVGYGYTGAACGPFALLNPADFPAVLAHAESQAAAAGRPEFALWVPSTNRHAIDYLLAHHYSVRPFVATLFSDAPFGRLDHYINTDPPFLI
jgi:ribosomal protein S18 acetylase RimI-like enzyme